jgi:hypothetical protein
VAETGRRVGRKLNCIRGEFLESAARHLLKAGIVAKFLILVTDCHSQEMGELRVAEIEANAQLIWGTCCPAFPDQFRWFGRCNSPCG